MIPSDPHVGEAQPNPYLHNLWYRKLQPVTMDRRDFVKVAAACGACRLLPARPAAAQQSTAQHTPPGTEPQPRSAQVLPAVIAGMTLEQLRDDYYDRLFNRYLPFWDKGGYDKRFGGFMCELNDDGSVANDEKYIWYQGRGIWVYSFLYNHFGKDERWLDVARKTKDFMVDHMYAGEGKWHERARRDGTVTGGLGGNVYGWLFAAAGLTQYYRATEDKKSLSLATRSIWAAVKAHDDPSYTGAFSEGEDRVELPKKGLRSQAHSMVFVWVLSQLLSCHDDPSLAKLQAKHVDLIMNKFWNPEYGIANEYLLHDYARVPGAEGHMNAGHAIETLWMVADEALRIKDRKLFERATRRFRRLLEMCWDYVFEGLGSEDFLVFDTPKYRRGPKFSVKTMWAHCEVLIGCMMALEYTGQAWAKEWYERARRFTLRTMPVPGHGVWRQAVDRQGRDVKRIGISAKRRGNFHQPRTMMLSLLSLQRMIDHRRALTPFPG